MDELEWRYRKPWTGLQAEAAEIDDIKEQVERNRSEALDRPRTANRPPKSDEGRNGEMRFVEEGGSTYLYFRSNGSWYRIGSERVR